MKTKKMSNSVNNEKKCGKNRQEIPESINKDLKLRIKGVNTFVRGPKPKIE